MSKMIVQECEGNEAEQRWIVVAPETVGKGWCYSSHPTKEAAIADAEEMAEDMGYDGVEVRT